MTKTNTRSRIVSILLVLVMLLSLMPSLVVPAHAFWDDYDTGGDCPNCDHYHWAENVCDCQFCTIDQLRLLGGNPLQRMWSVPGRHALLVR